MRIEMLERSLLKTLCGVVAVSLLALGCDDDDTADANADAGMAQSTIVDVAAGDTRFTTLVDLVGQAGLAETLASEGPFTVLAPTDDAFAAVPEDALAALAADTDALRAVLLDHVVEGAVSAEMVVGMSEVTTISGRTLAVVVEGDRVTIGGVPVVATDIEASNGVIHVIGGVILPETEAPPPEEPGNIAEVATEAGVFGTLLAAVDAAGLTDTLANEGPFTVFAPTDDAFAALPEGTVEALLEDIPALTEILQYHVVAGELMSGDVVAEMMITTLLGETVAVRVEGENVFINDAQIIMVDVEASNGVIHVIDAVLIPEADEPPPEEPGNIAEVAAEAGIFTTLLAAVDAAGLSETLANEGPFTVFAPTDDAFAALPEGTVEALLEDIPRLTEILTYHVVAGTRMSGDVVMADTFTTLEGRDVTIRVEGENVFIDDAQIITVDVEASNGVIHVIDAVLIPEADEPPPEEMNIIDTATAAGNFGTLLAAVDAAGLTATLSGEGEFTVFAPTDDAFAALPDGTVDALLEDIPRLTEVLLNHVAGAELASSAVVEAGFITTLQGTRVPVRVEGEGVFIGDAQITVVDIQASNGVIHVIDAVLVPPADIVTVAQEAGSFETLLAAVNAAGLTETLQGDGPFTVFAPTDAAFEALIAQIGQEAFDDLVANAGEEGSDLANILLLHVIGERVFADGVVAAESLTALGGELMVEVADGMVMVGGATVMMTDVQASNGVIHVIDAVILPAE